ncbi:MAG: hypothetical protein GOU99_03390 [Candidatus Altiarchaeota archaeon]|nr:hypothetical protein [Candidatus Altiarchaeota archaeon]
MKKAVLLLLLVLLSQPVLAQDQPELPGALQPFSDAFSALFDTLSSIGFLPSFELEGTALLDSEDFRAFLVIFLMFWMVFETFIELNSIFSFAFSLILTSFLQSNFPTMFAISSAQSSFQFVFSALFIYLLLDFIMRFVWALKPGTKLVLKMTIVFMAVMFMDFTNIYDAMHGWVVNLVGGVGFIGFIIFLITVRVFYMFFAMMNLGPALQMRDAAGSLPGKTKEEIEKAGKAYTDRRGGRK